MNIEELEHSLAETRNALAETQRGVLKLAEMNNRLIKIKFTLIPESDHLLCETCQLKWLDFKENAMPRVAKEFIGGNKE